MNDEEKPEQPNNPNVFPVIFDPHIHAKGGLSKDQIEELTKGMCLRDHFAAQAMHITYRGNNLQESAELAYKYADAMLKARIS